MAHRNGAQKVADNFLIFLFTQFSAGKLGDFPVTIFINDTAIHKKVLQGHNILRQCAGFIRKHVVNLRRRKEEKKKRVRGEDSMKPRTRSGYSSEVFVQVGVPRDHPNVLL